MEFSDDEQVEIGLPVANTNKSVAVTKLSFKIIFNLELWS